MSESLVALDKANMGVSFTPEAEASKLAALESAALISRVTSPAEQANAVEAQKDIARVLKAVEDARTAAKKPVLDYGRKIDDAAKQFVSDLASEQNRISRLVGDFQSLELARAKAAEALRVAELNAIEKRREAELAVATTHEERDAIQERACIESASVPIVVPTKAVGQSVREDWEFNVFDLWALARTHPMCVKLTPMLSEIRSLLDSGITPPGVTAKKVVKAGVRIGREIAAIEA